MSVERSAAAAVPGRLAKEGGIMENNARVPAAFFSAGSLFGGHDVAVGDNIKSSLELGPYTINWFYRRALDVRHMAMLMAILRGMKKQDYKDKLPMTLVSMPTSSNDTLKAVVGLWDSLQRQQGVWTGSIKQLLIEAKLDETNPDNYKAAREFLFNETDDQRDAGLDIQVNLVGGGIKRCRPVSIFKSSILSGNIITVRINWFFAAAAFSDFKGIGKEELRAIKYSRINVDALNEVPSRGGWLNRAVFIWLSYLSNGFQQAVKIEWDKFEALVFGYKRDRTKRQRYDHIRQLKKSVVETIVNLSTRSFEGDFDAFQSAIRQFALSHDSASAKLSLPVFKIKSLPVVTPVPSETAAPSQFETFWQIWPSTGRKQAKGYCLKLWEQFGLDDPDKADKVLRRVRELKQSRDWRHDPEKFIPAPANWLKRESWE